MSRTAEQIVACSIQSCGRAVFARGWCHVHYRKWRDHGSVDYMPPTDEERFWTKVAKTDRCWNWCSTATPEGYGQFSVGNRQVGAHRFAYEVVKGPIPAGMHLDHLCRNPRCVNPEHLEAVSPRTNMLRGIGPSALNARKTHCPAGHEYDYFHGGQRFCKTCRLEADRRWRERKQRMAS